MALEKTFIPVKPFSEFKWQWASVQCTEGLNDPVVLLGVLNKMRELEGSYNYNSEEFTKALKNLEDDIKDSVSVNLSGRTGERNLIRNSGQYWKAVKLIDNESHGTIKLTEFGRKVADREISQAEFAVATIKTLTLPNPNIQKPSVCEKWSGHGITFQPLMLILKVLKKLHDIDLKEAYLTADELIKIVIPLSGIKAEIEDYTNFILWYRENELDLSKWPNCCSAANDNRMAREFLIFLNNYGYLKCFTIKKRFDTKYFLNAFLLEEINEISSISYDNSIADIINQIRNNEIASDIERKRILAYRTERPNQNQFRKKVLKSFNGKCIITRVSMPEVLEAAHIKPVEYKGNDTIGNGLCMRLDIHQLFDTGHLRLDINGNIFLSPRARSEYGYIIPDKIVIPSFVVKEYIKWRWDNYNGI